ncbi:trypsin-like serine peptidase [Methylibium petroleiphilum]|uniref:trypsin-like serine peptidase n=1 Tax=Methylibium petroleiphilum TaxID=105560 RepID=UPI003D2A763F
MDLHRTLSDTARGLLAAGGALQSIDGSERIDRPKVKDALVQHLKQLQPAESTALELAASQVITTAEGALQRTVPGGDTRLADSEFDCLEVIVQVLGRPALRLPKGKVQPPLTDLAKNERWVILVASARDHINRVASSIARLNLQRSDGRDEHIGTAWRLGADLIVTNRHVVARMVSDPTLEPSLWALDPGRSCVVDFSVTDEPAESVRHCVASLDYCAPEQAIDVAVLRLRSNGQPFPAPLEVSADRLKLGQYVDGDASRFVGAEVYVVGHPLERLPTLETLRVFGDADGRKRCSPGETTGLQVADPVFEHDCSTLGGSSGSAVFDAYEHRIVGIHMGGRRTSPSAAVGTYNQAVGVALLGEHRLGALLKSGVVQAP